MNSQVEQERVAIEKAIKVTEVKYFGDYEFSDDQREAVDTLVAAAQAHLAALASQPPVLDEREIATLSPDPVLPGEVREALEQARAALADYSEPTGYTDQNGDQLEADEAVHPGLLAQTTLPLIDAALAKLPKLTGEEV